LWWFDQAVLSFMLVAQSGGADDPALSVTFTLN
jgi:hypothetical protein